MKEAVVREGFKNWLVIVGTKHPTHGLIKLDILDRFSTRKEAEEKAALSNMIFKRCAEYAQKYAKENSKVLVGALLGIMLLLGGCNQDPVWAEEITLKASWYSVESLKKEGTYKYSKGVMANGKLFRDNDFTCANRLYPLGSVLRITNLENGRSVIVRTTDRIGKRFGKTRIDLSRMAFNSISELSKGIIPIKVEVIK